MEEKLIEEIVFWSAIISTKMFYSASLFTGQDLLMFFQDKHFMNLISTNATTCALLLSQLCGMLCLISRKLKNN